ncbi:MAG: sigma 54-interacting transcriptional regulator [Firmicutes bacterium]|nr:sigma 54-interacting transcriptional regulator [Bacillota bacterium]
MEFEAIGSLLSDFVEGIVIAGADGVIAWHGGRIDASYEVQRGKRFSEVFGVDAPGTGEKGTVLTTPQGRKIVLRGKRVAVGGASYHVVFVDDMTNLKSKESRLHCLETIIESINDGVLMSDFEGRIALYNRAQQNLEGIRGEEAVGKYLWDTYHYNPELSEHRRVFKTGVPIIERYRAHAYKDGVPQYLTYSTYPLVKDGETIAVYSISRNETKLRALLYETIELKRKLLNGPDQREDLPNNGTAYTFADIKGESQAIRGLVQEAQMMALLDTNVLIVGETGTGKELFAQSIHNHGMNSKKPFVAINCAAIPEALLESILFGTVKGAYTGAVDQIGLLEHAQDGTLFLDEISSMPVPLQSKLTRVLQERAVRRVGGLSVAPVRCRIISAANEDPHRLIQEERLRLDLFHRIAGTCLIIPPLRERKDDILYLSQHLINYYNRAFNKRIDGLAPELKDLMLSYPWPGNVRELEHFVENLMVRAGDDQTVLDVHNIPLYLRRDILGKAASLDPAPRPATPGWAVAPTAPATVDERARQASLPEHLRDYEEQTLRKALDENGWNISRAARSLGILRQSLQYRMKKMGIIKPSPVLLGPSGASGSSSPSAG